MRALRLCVVWILCLSTIAAAQSESERFHRLLDTEWDYTMVEFPEFATFTGYPGQNNRWTDQSAEAIEARKAHTRDLLPRVEAIDRAALDPADRLSYDLFLKEVRETNEGHRFPSEYMPVDQLSGVQQSLASVVTRMPSATVKNYEDIIARLRSADRRIEQEISLLRWGLETGVTPPGVPLRDVPEQIRNQIVDDPADSPLMKPFERFPADISERVRERLRAEAARAIEKIVVPAYRRMHAFFENDYMPGTRDSIAMTDLPEGEAWYAYRVRLMTTTDLTPQEIHELGLREVARIRGEMERVIASTDFEGTFDEFLDFLRTDPQFYFTDADELMRAYRDIAKRIDPELPKLFATLPRNPYGVKRIPSYAEKSQTTAYYEPGSPAAGRPGYFAANTYALDTRPKWEMEALTVHEAVPGHHIQISIAQELGTIPEFRKHGGYTAFVEGWGLYAESLGEEIGLYEDPYSKFGQLTYEMWRAVRLVVDTGMHALGWTRQRAIDFFAANSSKPLHDITVEIDRYIVWPGQALAYKIGELKFKELRARAKEALGEDFDLRTFHDACLENGAVPMDILERHIDAWIESQRAPTE